MKSVDMETVLQFRRGQPRMIGDKKKGTAQSLKHTCHW